MAWARLDDERWRNRKIRRLSWAAIGLDDVAISYCCDHMTDGKLSPDDIDDICAMHASSMDEITPLIDELIRGGRWVVDGDGWAIHDFLVYNKSRAQAEIERSKTAQRVSRHRGQTQTEEQPVCNGAVTPLQDRYTLQGDEGCNASVTPLPARPVPVPFPSRPGPPERASARAEEASATRGISEPEPEPEHIATLDALRSTLRRRDGKRYLDAERELRRIAARTADYAGIPRTHTISAMMRALTHLETATREHTIERWDAYLRKVVLAEAQNGAAEDSAMRAKAHARDNDAAVAMLRNIAHSAREKAREPGQAPTPDPPPSTRGP